MHLFSLKDKVALVTGASRGLGRSMAMGLAQAGAHVVLLARDTHLLAKTASEIQAQGGSADYLVVDLSEEKAVVAAVSEALKRHGRLDVLINNAGVCYWQPLAHSSLTQWQQTFDVNLTASYLLAREAAKSMVQQGSGSIISVASYVAKVGREKLHAYVASKHGVIGLTKSLAAELGPQGVRCNAICLGYFLTDMAEPVTNNPALFESIERHIALGRWGNPDELQGAAIFLASEASGYVNGHSLTVDGGVSEILCLPVSVV